MTRSVDRLSFLDSTFPAVPKIIQALEARDGAMRARELAKLLGVTRQHVYKMAAEGTIPSFVWGRQCVLIRLLQNGFVER